MADLVTVFFTPITVDYGEIIAQEQIWFNTLLASQLGADSIS